MNVSRRPVLERWVLGGVVLVAPIGSDQILRLEGTAADLWSRIGSAGAEIDDVVAALAADYSADT
ncbi:MAG: PqqD family peptide modification chaperone, partial [Acidimicrobiales bacterium]|nr:PqqD family peptide modification chaperone [Acidimicrobiales bacterium]